MYQLRVKGGEWIDLDEINLKNELEAFFGLWQYQARLWLETWGYLKHPINGVEYRIKYEKRNPVC